MKNNSLNELEIIHRIKTRFAFLPHNGMEGISDDCAVIPLSEKESLVVTTDTLTENTHFVTDRISAEDLGYKSLASNLSDVLAMGAAPIGSFLSVALKNDLTQEWVEQFTKGYYDLSETFSVPLLGGDTTLSPLATTVSITAIGRVANQNIKRRSGAHEGDTIAVVAPLGASGGGLNLLLRDNRHYTSEERELILYHTRPPLYAKEALFFGTLPEVSAMMDISDGIAKDLTHILSLSGCGAKIFTSKIPTLQLLRYLCNQNGWDATELALTAGEEYAPLITIRKGSFDSVNERYKTIFAKTLFPIGVITSSATPTIEWHDENGLTNKTYTGYTHKQ